MFGFFKKDPVKKLQKEYLQLMEKARDIQRSGDVVKAALVYEEAEKIAVKIEELSR
ncbi:MAG: DUF6435 family protein [Chitinophagales bacterium]